MQKRFATLLSVLIAMAVLAPHDVNLQEPTPSEDDDTVTIIVPRLAVTEKTAPTQDSPPTVFPTPTLRAPIREIVQYEALRIPVDVNPLTGLRADASTLNRRPLVVKVSNAPAAVRPQAGLSSADIVIEHTVESGLTRLSAVFYGNSPERVGSVRSARLIDTDIVRMFDALLAYSGGSQGVRDDIYWYIPYRRIFLDGATNEFVRDGDIPAPHNLFALPVDIWVSAARLGEGSRAEDISGTSFQTIAPEGAMETANYLQVQHISLSAEWSYDAELKRYLRYTDGEVHGDSLNGQQLAVENVIVIYAYHELSDIIEDIWNENVSYGHDISLLGSGDMLLFRDGRVYEGRWSRARGDAQLRYFDLQNAPLYLKPGATWIHIVKLPQQMRSGLEWVSWEE